MWWYQPNLVESNTGEPLLDILDTVMAEYKKQTMQECTFPQWVGKARTNRVCNFRRFCNKYGRLQFSMKFKVDYDIKIMNIYSRKP